MLFENQSDAFTVNLYLNGKPVVLNEQRLKLRLSDARITRRERLDNEVALASNDSASILTLADHEDDPPLLLKFIPRGHKYEVVPELPGADATSRLKVNAASHHLYASNGLDVFEFSIRKHQVERALFRDLESGPAYVQIVSEVNGRPLYLANEAGRIHFKNVDPNDTTHDAFNNKPANFIIKIIDKPENQ
jgi:hypothetical protein